MSAAYGLISLVALLLIGVCLGVDRKRDIWLLSLFASVFVCDFGYFLVSISKTLDFALMANRISYLGSVFLPLFMLMMILNLCEIKYPRWISPALIAVGIAILVIAASPGYLDIYYKSAAIETINGATRLIREYGPLHFVYSVYLGGYFTAMTAVVCYAIIKKKVTCLLHAAFLLVAVLGNIIIWFIERFIPRNFEFLSVSYILTEVFILLLYGILQEYSLVKKPVQEEAPTIVRTAEAYMSGDMETQGEELLFTHEQIEHMLANCESVAQFTNRERDVLRLMLESKKRKDIAAELCVTESTIKKYTSQIYRKLSVGSRIELFAKLKNL